MKKAIRNTALALGAGTLGLSAALYRLGISRNMYIIPKLRAMFPDKSDAQQQYDAVRPQLEAGREWFRAQQVDELRIRSFDGLSLYARYLACEGSKKTVILCHGYRGTGLGDFGGIVRYLHEDLRLNILMIDERSHAKSEGKHMTYGVKERFDICGWSKLMAKEHPDHKLYLYGISMGAASVMMAASTELPESVCGIIADCGFTSPDDIFRSVAKSMCHLPPFPFVDIAEIYSRIFAGFDFSECSAKQAVSQTDIPMLFFHGSKDDFVPPYMSKENYEACSSEKKLVIIEGAYHATSYYIDFEKYTKELADFIDKH